MPPFEVWVRMTDQEIAIAGRIVRWSIVVGFIGGLVLGWLCQ